MHGKTRANKLRFVSLLLLIGSESGAFFHLYIHEQSMDKLRSKLNFKMHPNSGICSLSFVI